jgi:uncharacterized protein (TIGR03086 family)
MDENMIKAVCASTERVVAGLGPQQFELPTPCSEWNVGQLTNHVLATLELGRALLSDDSPRVAAGPGDVPAEDMIGGDALGAYQSGVAELITAATADAIGRSHMTPFGDMPGAALAGFTALDILVHGWDLARATGQDATLDPDLAEAMLGFARQGISEDMSTRPRSIGPKIDGPAAADATTRLVAYLGRQP